MTADQRPSDIKDYASVRDTPLVLAAVLIVFAVGTLAHVLLTGVRRRRRDLALLKTLGFRKVPGPRRGRLGGQRLRRRRAADRAAARRPAGRWAWASSPTPQAAPADATVPLTAVLLAIPVTSLLANLIAAWPGWTAARISPAATLRAE